jgi:hypothetical protein
MNIIIKSLLVFVGLVAICLFMFRPEGSDLCSRITEEAKNYSFNMEIRRIALDVNTWNSIETKSGSEKGFIDSFDLKNKTLINWELLGISSSSGSIKLNGKLVDYFNLSKSSIESILIGSGRAFVVADTNGNGEFDIEELNIDNLEIKYAEDNFFVVCRNNKYQ